MEKYANWRRMMSESTEDSTDLSQEELEQRQRQLALSYAQMQQMYDPMLRTSPSDFSHFMAGRDQAAEAKEATLLRGNHGTPHQDASNVKTDSATNNSKGPSLVIETEPEIENKKRTQPKRLQKQPKSLSAPTKRKARSKGKLLGKPFQVYDDVACFVCNLFCGNLAVLEEHLKSPKHVCRVCTKTFDLHVELEQHFTTHKPSICKTCGTVSYCKADYYKHVRGNAECSLENAEIKCDICDKKFARKKTLRIHKIQYHTNNEAKFKCVVCSKPFNLSWMLNLHLSKTHFVSEHIECLICHRIFLGVDSLKNHMNLKHFTGSEHTKSFGCTVCKQEFNKETSLISHMKHRHDKTETLCEDCGMSVFGHKAMQEHKRMNHPRENETFICEICHQTFDEYKPYRQHRKLLHHKKPEPQFCEICGKEFKTPSTLRHHYAVHRDERKWECEICGASFKQKVALTTHMRVHSDVKRYNCDNCGESFRWKQTFDKHVKMCAASHFMAV